MKTLVLNTDNLTDAHIEEIKDYLTKQDVSFATLHDDFKTVKDRFSKFPKQEKVVKKAHDVIQKAEAIINDFKDDEIIYSKMVTNTLKSGLLDDLQDINNEIEEVVYEHEFVAIAVIDSASTTLTVLDLELRKGYQSEDIEQMLENEYEFNLSNCSWGVFDGTINDER